MFMTLGELLIGLRLKDAAVLIVGLRVEADLYLIYLSVTINTNEVSYENNVQYQLFFMIYLTLFKKRMIMSIKKF